MGKNKIYLAIAIIAVVAIFLMFFSRNNSSSTNIIVEKNGEQQSSNDWRNLDLTDVATGEKYKISDFKGKSVLIESFAVWCPTCLKQQKEVKKVKESEGDSTIHISLDTDPNEDESKVKGHLEKNGFDWFFSVASNDVTQSLIDDFGIGVINAPSAPVILVCEDQSARLLKRGVKSAEKLKEEIGKGCLVN